MRYEERYEGFVVGTLLFDLSAQPVYLDWTVNRYTYAFILMWILSLRALSLAIKLTINDLHQLVYCLCHLGLNSG